MYIKHKTLTLVILLFAILNMVNAQQNHYSIKFYSQSNPNSHLKKTRNSPEIDCRIISDSIISLNNVDSTIETKKAYRFFKYNSNFGNQDVFNLFDLDFSPASNPALGEMNMSLENKFVEQINSFDTIVDIYDTLYSWDNFNLYDTVTNTFNANHNLIKKSQGSNSNFSLDLSLSPSNQIDSFLRGSNRKGFFTYNNNLIAKIWYTENGDSTYRSTFSYNNSKLIEEIGETFNSAISTWDSSSKINYTYNADGFIDQVLVNNYALYNEIYNYVYNNDSTVQRLTRVTTAANPDTSKYDFIYNNNNKNVSEVHFSVNNIIQFKLYYFYNTSGLITKIKRYNADSLGGFYSSARFVYVYEDGCFPLITKSVNKENDLKFTVYPNPITDEFSITCKETILDNLQMTIYNSQGQKMKNETLKTNSTINMKEFKTGIYFILLTDKSGNNIYKCNILKN